MGKRTCPQQSRDISSFPLPHPRCAPPQANNVPLSLLSPPTCYYTPLHLHGMSTISWWLLERQREWLLHEAWSLFQEIGQRHTQRRLLHNTARLPPTVFSTKSFSTFSREHMPQSLFLSLTQQLSQTAAAVEPTKSICYLIPVTSWVAGRHLTCIQSEVQTVCEQFTFLPHWGFDNFWQPC